MANDLLTRRAALKFAGIIALVGQAGRSHPILAATRRASGYGSDPDLLRRPVTWPRTLNANQIESLAALCDIVLPAEPPHPSAKATGVHEFLDEWLSAPYPQMRADGALILGGLASLDRAMYSERGYPFARGDASQQAAVFDRACGAEATGAFSRRLIELICAGYYTTREGHAAIGYVGNVALSGFPAPSPEIVEHLHQALDAQRATKP